jgi:hypothetical protein
MIKIANDLRDIMDFFTIGAEQHTINKSSDSIKNSRKEF